MTRLTLGAMMRIASALLVVGVLCVGVGRAQIGPIPGIGPVILAPASPVTKGFGASATPQGGATSYTFTSQTYGLAASATRRVIACVNAVSVVAAETVSSLTIGGVSASIITDGSQTAAVNRTDGGGAFMETECWIALVSTGANGTVAFTMSNAQVRASIATWSLDNLQSQTATKVVVVGTAASTPPNGSINVSSSGALIGFCGEASNASNFTWTNLSLDFSANNGVNAINYSGASNTFAGTQTGLSVTCTPSSFGAIGAGMTLTAFR